MNFSQIFVSGQSLSSANDHPLHHDDFPEPEINQASFSSLLRLVTPLTQSDPTYHNSYSTYNNSDRNVPFNMPFRASSATTSEVCGASPSLLPIDSFQVGGGSSGGSSFTSAARLYRKGRQTPLRSVSSAIPLPEDIGAVKHVASLLAMFIENGEMIERWIPSEAVIAPCECPPGAIAVGAVLPMVLKGSIAGAGALVMLQSILNPEDRLIYQIAIDHPMVSHPFFTPQTGCLQAKTMQTNRIESRSKKQLASLCDVMDIKYRDASIDTFLCELLTRIPCSCETYIITLALFYRLARQSPPSPPSSRATKVMLLASYVLAVKSRDDKPFALSYYADAVGISTSEMMQIELCAWELLDYNAGVSCDDYITTLFSLRTYCSKGVLLDEGLWFQDAWGELLRHLPIPAMSDLSREIVATVHDEAVEVNKRQHYTASRSSIMNSPRNDTIKKFDMTKSFKPDFMQASNGVVPVWQVSLLECHCPNHPPLEADIYVDAHDS